MRIDNGSVGYEPRRLKMPFGFKGGHITTLWQTAVSLESGAYKVTGLGTQSILWSDSDIFACHGETKGNRLMLAVSRYAVELVKGAIIMNPRDMITDILGDVYRFAQKITGNEQLKKTFVLNALTPLDNALWLLYMRHKGFTSFDDILHGESSPKLLNIPLIAYNTSLDELKSILAARVGLLKIKIGFAQHGSDELTKMLMWDQNRLAEIHEIARTYFSPYTTDGYIRYYLDANGRYSDKKILARFLEFAQKIGALERIAMLEEPFPETYAADVSDLPVAVAMDESAHSVQDVKDRIGYGYSILALKPIAKTLSMSLLMLEAARVQKISCFCADLTVNPNLVQWNQNVAARLAPLSCMNIGAFESNGSQNYTDWAQMKRFCPAYRDPDQGIFVLDNAFYEKSGGIFDPCPHYQEIAKRG